MNNGELIIRLMEKYHYAEKVSPEMQVRILQAKQRCFSEISGQRKSGLGSFIKENVMTLKEGFSAMNSIMNKKTIFAAAGVFCIAAAVTAVLLLTGDTKKPTEGVAVFITGNVTVERNGVTASDVKPGYIIKTSDIIRTGGASFVAVQIEDLGVVRVNENTVVSFSIINDGGKTLTILDRGSVYSKLNKIKKGDDYRVKTPTYVAAVRGTEFLSTMDGASGSVQVLDGKVAVSSKNIVKEESVVDGGKGLMITDSVADPVPFDLEKKDITTLKKMSLYDYVDGAEDKKESEINDLLQKIKEQEKTLDAQAPSGDVSNLSPLDRLRAAGKPLTMLYMRDGSQIAGSLVKQNETVLIMDTGDGVIQLPKAEVIRRITME